MALKMNCRLSYFFLLVLMLLGAGCANIVPPAGGDKDVTPPRLVSVNPADSQLNVRTSKIRFDFDEYIVISDAVTQVIISPILPIPPTVTALNKHVTISFPDSLLQENTTYHLSLGNAVRDNHEGNIYKANDYIFSTGSYFDSLRLSGRIVNAATGLADTAATVVLYGTKESDSAVLRHKPLYAIHADMNGRFNFTGLPQRAFRIYALQDKNGNLTLDDAAEWIGFLDHTVTPGADTAADILIRTFPRLIPGDTVRKTTSSQVQQQSNSPAVGYQVLADTSDTRRRTQDITQPLKIRFPKPHGAINRDKIFLSYDSSGMTMEVPLTITVADTPEHVLELQTPWAENTVYMLRLQKGFAKDTTGNDFLPGRYSFRTKQDGDYGKLGIHLPSKYYGQDYILQVSNEADTVYQKPVTDSMVSLVRLSPGSYVLRIIEDRNHNGHWDTGDLLNHVQPEIVTPYEQTILLKAGWENQLDFEKEPVPNRKSPQNSPGSPQK